MHSLRELLKRLAARHRRCLSWFVENAGTDQPWPKPLPGGFLLATRAKGIFKPKWTEYALSVRQTLSSPYADREPIFRPDGSWSFDYFQESKDLEARDNLFTNLAMLKCSRDQVPVGVMKQTRLRPLARYRILGVALVSGWKEGYFRLEGFNSKGLCTEQEGRERVASRLEVEEIIAGVSKAFDPQSITDARQRIIASVVRRRGQPEFRRKLLDAYQGRCAVTDCDAIDALEAVHIVPYRGPNTNHPSNGLLLRADLHTLFDLGLIAVDTSNMTVLVSPRLFNTYYATFEGARLRLPKDPGQRPSRDALHMHRSEAGI